MNAKIFFILLFCLGSAFAETQVVEVQASSLISETKGTKATLVNMWATWCVPCLQEFPALVKLLHAYQSQGLKVLFVSNDLQSELPEVKKFLEKEGVAFPTYIKAQKDNEFINGIDPAWSGALPATFLYDRNGKLVKMHEGPLTYAQFEQMIKPLLGKE